MGTDKNGLVAVFQGNRWEAELVKGLLNSAGVEAIIDDKSMSAVTSPYIEVGSEVVVLVNREEEVYARKVVADRHV